MKQCGHVTVLMRETIISYSLGWEDAQPAICWLTSLISLACCVRKACRSSVAVVRLPSLRWSKRHRCSSRSSAGASGDTLSLCKRRVSSSSSFSLGGNKTMSLCFLDEAWVTRHRLQHSVTLSTAHLIARC